MKMSKFNIVLVFFIAVSAMGFAKGKSYATEESELLKQMRVGKQMLKDSNSVIMGLEKSLNALIKKSKPSKITENDQTQSINIGKFAGCFLQVSGMGNKSKQVDVMAATSIINFNFNNKSINNKKDFVVNFEKWKDECGKHKMLLKQLFNLGIKLEKNNNKIKNVNLIEEREVKDLVKCMGACNSWSNAINESDLKNIRNLISSMQEREFVQAISKFKSEMNTFNLYLQSKDLGSLESEKEIEEWAINFFIAIKSNPSLLKKVDVPVLVDIFKNITLRLLGTSEKVAAMYEEFMIKNYNDIFKALQTETIAQNFYLSSFVRNHGQENEELDPNKKDNLYYFLKHENDIMALVALRNTVSSYVISNLKRSLSSKGQNNVTIENSMKEEISKWEILGEIVDESYFRLIVGMKAFQNLTIDNKKMKDKLSSLIRPEKDEGGHYKEINLELDFESYGRWGAMGDKVKDIFSLEKKLQKNPKLEEVKHIYEQIISDVMKRIAEGEQISGIFSDLNSKKVEFKYDNQIVSASAKDLLLGKVKILKEE
ncbi:MAG: hypothetical protein HQK49_11510 [Oligoflexia bacterium]|nr:hypothetical protein [Oligoflexia bacterium]